MACPWLAAKPETVMRYAFILTFLGFSLALSGCGGESGDGGGGGGTGSALSLNSIGNRSLLSGDSLTIQLSATDPNSQSFTWAADGNRGAGNPFMAGATFNESSGVFNWSDTSSAVGNYAVLFTVYNNSGESDSETVTIQVADIFTYGETSYNQYCQSCHGDEGLGGNEQIVQCIDETSLAFGMSRSPMNSIGSQWVDYDREFNAILYYLNNVQPQNC
jgi:hypothetical protein